MDATRKAAGDVQHAESVANTTQTIWQKIVPMKPNALTAQKTILYFQDLVAYTKERGK